MGGLESGISGLVKWPGLIFSLLVSTILAVALGAGAVWWIGQNYQLSVPVAAHEAKVSIPKGVDAAIHLSEPLKLNNTELETDVKLEGTLNVPVLEQIETIVSVDATTPVSMQMVYKGTVPVDAELTLTGKSVRATFEDQDIALTINGAITLAGDLPLEIDQAIELDSAISLKTPVTLIVDHELKIPVKSAIRTTLPITQSLNVSDTKVLDATIKFADQALPVNIDSYTLNAPLAVEKLLDKQVAQ